MINGRPLKISLTNNRKDKIPPPHPHPYPQVPGFLSTSSLFALFGRGAKKIRFVSTQKMAEVRFVKLMRGPDKVRQGNL